MIKNISSVKRFYKHLFVLVFVLFAGFYMIELSIEQEKERYLSMQTEILQVKYDTNYNYFKIMSKDIYTIYQENNSITTLIAKANDASIEERSKLREILYKKLKKRYKRFRNMGILQLHFHLKNNISFLRMHAREKFGDDLTKYRPSIAAVNQTQKPKEGFEVGKMIHGFRFVYPLFSNKKHIGSVEISFSSEKLMETLVSSLLNMYDSHFLISKELIEKNLWQEYKNKLYSKSSESENYLIETRTQYISKESIPYKINDTISKKIESGHSFSIVNVYNNETSVGTFIAIKNSDSKQAVAYIVIYSQADYLDHLAMKKQYIEILFVSLTLLLFIFSIYVTLNNEKLQKMAHFDKLTGLSNRAYFYIELEKEISRSQRLNSKLAVMFIDLDGFKAVNDTYGHDTGDKLLVDVSRRLSHSVRDVDLVARLGGDEFTIALTNVAGEEEALMVANKIIAKLQESFFINKTKIYIGASIGISILPDYANNSDEIMKQSDDAMYFVKENGKNCAIVYKPSTNSSDKKIKN